MKSLLNIKQGIFLLLVGLLFSACKNENQVKNNLDKKVDNVQKVTVELPQNRSFTAEVLITGIAKPNQMVTIYAMESGVLSRISKDIGDKVSKGETIAVLKNPVLIQEQIKLRAKFQAKKIIYNRLKTVFEKTPALTPIQLVESAEADFLVSKASLIAIESRISFLTIKAPFSGIISKRFVDNGAMLQNGLEEVNPKAIVEIQEVNPVRLTLTVPESDAVAIKTGVGVQVTFPELSGETYTATISRTSGVLDSSSGTMQVEIDIENSEEKIITGMYAKVLLRIQSRACILSLPIITKVNTNNEVFVLVVENNVVKRLPVKIGLSDKDYFEVINAEITPKTQVITNGKGLVNEGQIVTPILK
ncbi:efflux RND transporter periplasmic adaptor subunit [Flavobacterium sp. RSP49]|uniref:efflux RND transporter periplasmic adaptor subunit n=1 Tax=Flavobacterium sp. RSP49 TaxID=2497487 RepID=UPI000F8486C9|nr:efflux RND transporter periplasmic adaptor subunit [Flavobacterium sp. RSP49]RTZ03305.1 efflux RND transporter periplasmic adaptor subunit [Flavobacterium sp. RSP49]